MFNLNINFVYLYLNFFKYSEILKYFKIEKRVDCILYYELYRFLCIS